MTAEAGTPSRARRVPRALGAAIALAVLAGSAAACADEATGPSLEAGGTFEATAAYLQQAAERSAGEGHRIEMLFSLDGEVADDADPLMSGEIDGDRFHYVMDLRVMLDEMSDAFGEALPPDFDDLDLTLEMGGDGTVWYLRAPMFTALDQLNPSLADLEAGKARAELGDGWGRVDVSTLGDLLPGDLQGALLGGQSFDPDAAIALVENADGVEELGRDELRGTGVRGMRAEVTLGDLVESTGTDAEAYADLGATADTDAVVDALYAAKMPVEVWVDDEGYLRRLTFGFAIDDIFEAIGTDADLAEPGLSDLHFWYALDMFDYGTGVQFDAPEGAIDITDAFAELMQQ
jgi:hypothetical protein